MPFIQRKVLLAGIAMGSALAGIALGKLVLGGSSAPLQATVLSAPRALPAFELVDGEGDPFGREDLAGRWSLLFFGFTHCPDVCPLTLQTLARVSRELGGGTDSQSAVAVLFVSVDPERDTPQRVARYVTHFDPRFEGLTGSSESIAALAAAVGVAYGRTPLPGGEGYTVDHTAALFLVNPAAELAAVLTPPHDALAIVADLRAIIRSGS